MSSVQPSDTSLAVAKCADDALRLCMRLAVERIEAALSTSNRQSLVSATQAAIKSLEGGLEVSNLLYFTSAAPMTFASKPTDTRLGDVTRT